MQSRIVDWDTKELRDIRRIYHHSEIPHQDYQLDIWKKQHDHNHWNCSRSMEEVSSGDEGKIQNDFLTQVVDVFVKNFEPFFE